PRRAERLVDARQHPPQRRAAVRREQPQPALVPALAERRERELERLAPQHRALLLVELAEARIDARRERVGAEEARAEAVDGRDPRAVELPREVVPTALAQRLADARPQLARRLAGVRDSEHRVHVETVVADGSDEPLHEHRRLAGAGAG